MSDILQCLIGRPLLAVEFNKEADRVTFVFEDGEEAYSVRGDCCSHSWIEHVTLPDDIAGQKITAVCETGGAPKADEDLSTFDCLAVYEARFSTPKGDIVLEFRNDSNGYYGGYLVKA